MQAAIAGFPGDRMVITAMRMEAIGHRVFLTGRRLPSGPALRKIRLVSGSRAWVFTPVSKLLSCDPVSRGGGSG